MSPRRVKAVVPGDELVDPLVTPEVEEGLRLDVKRVGKNATALETDDPVRASKLLKEWVDAGLLVVVNPASAKQHRRYALPEQGNPQTLTLFSSSSRKQERHDS